MPKCGKCDSETYSDIGQNADLIALTMKFLEKKKAINAIQTGRLQPDCASSGHAGLRMVGNDGVVPKINR